MKKLSIIFFTVLLGCNYGVDDPKQETYPSSEVIMQNYLKELSLNRHLTTPEKAELLISSIRGFGLEGENISLENDKDLIFSLRNNMRTHINSIEVYIDFPANARCIESWEHVYASDGTLYSIWEYGPECGGYISIGVKQSDGSWVYYDLK